MYEEKKELMQEAGNLCEEICELKKTISNNGELEVYASSTKICGMFLTIHCC